MVDDGWQVTKKIEDVIGVLHCGDSFLWFWVQEFGIVSREALLKKVEELGENVKTICRSFGNEGDALSAITMSTVYGPRSFYELEEKCRTHLEEKAMNAVEREDREVMKSYEQATAET